MSARNRRLQREASASSITTTASEPIVAPEPDADAAPAAETEAPASEASESVDVTTVPVFGAGVADLAAAIALLQANGMIVRSAADIARSATPRSLMAKADPDEVKAYFASTGLTRKQIAGAVGVCTSVIATVQNVKGDRWSQERYEKAKVLIDAEKARLAAPPPVAPDSVMVIAGSRGEQVAA